MRAALSQRLGQADVNRAQLARVFGVLLGAVGNVLTLCEALEAFRNDRGEMHEHVVAALVVRDEAETLIVVEPFNSTLIHIGTSHKNVIRNHKIKKPQAKGQNEN